MPSRKKSSKRGSKRGSKGSSQRKSSKRKSSKGKDCPLSRKATKSDIDALKQKVIRKQVIYVRLSGGPDKQHFDNYKNKSEVESAINDMYPFVEFVHNSKADAVIIPSRVRNASDTALSESCGKVYALPKFMMIIAS